jgi:hypothetical protein
MQNVASTRAPCGRCRAKRAEREDCVAQVRDFQQERRRGTARALARAAQEEEPVARVQHLDLPAARGEEGEGGVHRGRATVSTGRSNGRLQDGEAPGGGAGDEEEAGEGLREPGAVGGVGDEAAAAPGDALEAAERLGRQPREDVDDEVVGEVGRRRCTCTCTLLHPGRSMDSNLLLY